MSSAVTRRQRLEVIIKKRMMGFEYLKDFFHGDTFWMNCIYFSKLDIKKIVSTSNYKANEASATIDEWFEVGLLQGAL